MRCTNLYTRACLGEIDRCKQENINPFFINMLGNRYGWVPEPGHVPQSVVQQYQWIHGASVTHMEIIVGIINIMIVANSSRYHYFQLFHRGIFR